jgi:hypothetical protein
MPLAASMIAQPRILAWDEPAQRVHIQCRIGVADGDDASRFADNAAAPTRRNDTSGGGNCGPTGRIVMGLIKRHPEYALAWRNRQLPKLPVVIRDDLSAKNLTFRRVKHRELSGSHRDTETRLQIRQLCGRALRSDIDCALVGGSTGRQC